MIQKIKLIYRNILEEAARGLPDGVELVTNGGMETGNPPTGWSAYYAPETFEQSGVQKHSGSFSAHIIGSAGGKGFGKFFSATPGKKYRVSFWHRIVSGLLDVNNQCDWRINITQTIGAWVYEEQVVTSSAPFGGGTQDSPFFMCAGGPAEFYIDDVSVQQICGVGVTSENPEYSRYRLYDRDIGKFFKGNSTPSHFYITLNQGAPPDEVDRLLIPAGHNLNDLTLKLQYSTDDFVSDIHDAASWVQSGSGLIDKTFTAQTKIYWRLDIASPVSAPQLAEMFLGKVYTLERNPSWGFEHEDRRNVSREESSAGKVLKTVWGGARMYRRYDLTRISDAQKAELKAWDDHCEGVKPFYIEDESGSLFFAELLENGLGEFKAESEGRWGVSFEVLEVLP